jgi:hypothetical protein
VTELAILSQVPSDTRKATFTAIEDWLKLPDPDEREADYLLAFLEARRPVEEAALIAVTVLTGFMVSIFVLASGIALERSGGQYTWAIVGLQLAAMGGFVFGILATNHIVGRIRTTALLSVSIRAHMLRQAAAKPQKWWQRVIRKVRAPS